jgi:IS5 family transposase
MTPDQIFAFVLAQTAPAPADPLFPVIAADGRPIRLFMTAGQVSDCTGAAALPGSVPKADWLAADHGHDADWFREALKDKGIKPCIPGRKPRGKPIKHDKRR